MEKRTAGIIATIVTVLLCGCPGLFGIFFGAMFALIGNVPGADIDVFGSSNPQSAVTFGIVSLCGGVLLVLIPVVVGILTLRNKPAAQAVYTPPPPPPPVYGPDEPIPPAN